MKWSGNVAAWQRKVAEGPEGAARRRAVVEALAPQPGEQVIDIGCGGGHLVRDLARTLAPDGRATGIEMSPDQLAAAHETCAGLSNVELHEGDATALPFETGTFDAAATIQTFEYIPDVDAALRETARILKPGGRAALVSVLWDHWSFHGADEKITAAILDIWRAHCAHQMLPFELEARMKGLGFTGFARRPLAFVNTTLGEDAYAHWAVKYVEAFALARGFDPADMARWVAELHQAEREGRFGFVSVPVLTTAAIG